MAITCQAKPFARVTLGWVQEAGLIDQLRLNTCTCPLAERAHSLGALRDPGCNDLLLGVCKPARACL